MKWCAIVALGLAVFLANGAFSADIEQRQFMVRVVDYDMVNAILDAVPIEDTIHLDCLVFEILAPEELKGKRWHLFIYNQVWSPPVDYGYREGDVLQVDVPKLGITKRELAEMMASTEWLNSIWIQNQLIKKLEPVRPDNGD